MAIDLISGTGLFDRMGKLGYLLNIINSRFGGSSANDFPTELNDFLVKYDAGSNAVRDTVDALLPAFLTFQGTPTTFRSALRTAAENTLIQMADADNPLDVKVVASALDELIRQMIRDAASVDRSEPTIATLVTGPRTGIITAITAANPPVVTSATHGLANGDVVSIVSVAGMTEVNNLQFYASAVATNTFALRNITGAGYTAYSSGGVWRASVGHGTVVTSLLNGKGKTLENCLAEDLVAKVTATTTAGSETFSLKGERDLSSGDKLSHLWPSGSGTSKTTEAIKDPSSAGFLTNGDFEAWTTNTPDSWTIDTGAAGTDMLQNTAAEYRGSSCAEFVGDSSTLIAISQAITGTVSRTPYAVSISYKCDVVPAAGVMVVDLYDGTAVINDDAGTANSISIDLTASETSYNVATGVFRLPEPVPATVTVRIRLTTAVSTGSSALVDDMIIGPAMTQVYTGGPYISVIHSDVAMAVDDEHTVTVTNARAGAFQELFDKLFQNPDKLLPSVTGAAETVDDALII